MSVRSSQIISYEELKNGSYVVENDIYDIAAYMTETRRRAFLACPNNTDHSKTAMYLMKVDGDVVGRTMLFETKLKLDGEIVKGQCGSALYVHEDFRNEIGAELMMYSLMNKECDYKLSAGFTSVVLPMYRKIKYVVFDIPEYIKLRSFRCIFDSFGIKGALLKMTTGIADFFMRVYDLSWNMKVKRLKKKYDVRKENIVPNWAGDMATNDGHRYMECHDRDWLQWVLDYNFNDGPDNIQSYYSIYDKKGNPKGFFMTKIREIESAGRYNRHLRGSVFEWGSNNAELNESALDLLALSTFAKDVDIVVTVSNSKEVESRLKRAGFVRHGSFQIAFKDKKKKMGESISDESMWRLRYGYSDTVLS